MYRYQIQKGAENRVFANARRLADNLLESDEPLYSPYLTAVKDEVTNMVAEKPAPVVSSIPANQPAQTDESTSQPAPNKEASE